MGSEAEERVKLSERHIRSSRERIARLKKAIKHLEGLGAEQQAIQARRALATFEAALAAELDHLEIQRRALVSEQDGR